MQSNHTSSRHSLSILSLGALALALTFTMPALAAGRAGVTVRTPAPPSKHISVSLSLSPGARASLGGPQAASGSVAHLNLTGELRLLSVLGVRAGVDTAGTEITTRRLRAGVSAHLFSSAVRPDLYVYGDMSWTRQGPQALVETRELSAGLGFRVRLGRFAHVGVEAGLVQGGLTGDSSLFNEALVQAVSGDLGQLQVHGVLGFVL
jgi:hypothetical protein